VGEIVLDEGNYLVDLEYGRCGVAGIVSSYLGSGLLGQAVHQFGV
jgi:hypothetical protein